MPKHNGDDRQEKRTKAEPMSHGTDDTDDKPSTGHKPTDSDDIPDGSGTHAQSSAPGHGQESGSETFDAG